MVDNSTKQRILEAGNKAVVAKSFNGCGLKEILDEAGVPKGSFYHYFKSKEDFGIALIEASSTEFLAFSRPFFTDRSMSPVERIKTFFNAANKHLEDSGSQRQCLLAKIALEESRLSEALRASIKSAYDQWQILLAQALREAQAVGEISPEVDVDALAGFIQNAWEGAMVRMEIDRDIKPLHDFLTFTIDNLPQLGRAPQQAIPQAT